MYFPFQKTKFRSTGYSSPAERSMVSDENGGGGGLMRRSVGGHDDGAAAAAVEKGREDETT